MKRCGNSSVVEEEPASKKACQPREGECEVTGSLDQKRAEMNSLGGDFHERSTSLRQLMQRVLKSKTAGKTDLSVEDQRRQGVVLISALKQINRTAQEQVKERREAVQEGKRRVDSLQLALQNLHYQVLHLKHEAAKCLDFQAVDQTISLASEEEVKEKLKSGGEDSSKFDDGHQMMLARLQFELDERQNLVSQRGSATLGKNRVIGEIKSLKEHLAGLRPGLSTLLKATSPVQTALQSTFAERRQMIETARHFPEPLYLLFAQLQAYAETHRESSGSSVCVSIGGDCEAGRKIAGQSIQELRDKYLRRDDDSDREAADEDDSQQRRKSKRRRTVTDESQRQSMVLQAHPMTVKLTIAERGCGSIDMVFRYLSILHVVVVQATPSLQAAQVASCSSLVSATGLLDDLLETDSGKQVDGSIAKQIFAKLNMSSFDLYADKVGLAYGWIQRLAGISGPQYGAESLKQLEDVIQAIRRRIDSRFALLQQVHALEQCEIPIRGDAAAFFPTRLSNKLVSFSRLKEPMSLSWICLSNKARLIKKTDICYVAQLERKTGERAQLHAAVFISQSYPQVTPLFIVHLINSLSASVTMAGGAQALSQFTALRSIEEELNVHFDELIDEKHDDVDILGLLIRRVQMCFDILVETESARPGDSILTEKRFLLPQGGRDHSRAFRYDAHHHIFTLR